MSTQQQGGFQNTVRAVVTNVLNDYVVTYPVAAIGDLTENDSVTFSLPRWEGGTKPQFDQVVELIDIVLYRRGWRALIARPVTPQQTRQLQRSQT